MVSISISSEFVRSFIQSVTYSSLYLFYQIVLKNGTISIFIMLPFHRKIVLTYIKFFRYCCLNCFQRSFCHQFRTKKVRIAHRDRGDTNKTLVCSLFYLSDYSAVEKMIKGRQCVLTKHFLQLHELL